MIEIRFNIGLHNFFGVLKMIITIVSILVGIALGSIYGLMFFSLIKKNDKNTKFNLKQVLGSFFRLVFITVAIIATVIYIKLNFIWLLCGFIGAFWGVILGKIRTKR